MQQTWHINGNDALRPVLSAADGGEHLREALGRLDALVAAPPTVLPFAEGRRYRLPGSRRSWFWTTSEDGPVIVVKGSEPLAADVDTGLAELDRPCYSWHDVDEHLVLEESKVPMAVTRHEAMAEADRAAAVHIRHLELYGEVARLPLPLAVLQHDPATVDRLMRSLSNRLAPPAAEAAAALAADGLAVLVYAYPAPPVRVRDVNTLLTGRAIHQRQFALLSLCDGELLVQRWVRLFTRILYCGFLPTTAASSRTGACCQPQNACLDGGFVDADSLVPMRATMRDRAVDVAVHLSAAALVDTVAALVLGSAESEAVGLHADAPDLQDVRDHVLHAIRRCLLTERPDGVALDPRVQAALAEVSDYGTLVRRLVARRVSRSAASTAAAADVTPAAMTLLARAGKASWDSPHRLPAAVLDGSAGIRRD